MIRSRLLWCVVLQLTVQLLPNLGAVCAGLQYSLTKHLVERLQRGVEFLESHRDLQVW